MEMAMFWVQVFCLAEEDAEAGELKTDVKKFLYDLRMGAEVIVLSMNAWRTHQEENEAENGRVHALEAFSKARKRITQRSSSRTESEPQKVLDEQQVSHPY